MLTVLDTNVEVTKLRRSTGEVRRTVKSLFVAQKKSSIDPLILTSDEVSDSQSSPPKPSSPK